MRKDRLLKLADFLETVPRKTFNINFWQASEPTKPEGQQPGECGFAGCAMGWAAHEKLFRGLKMVDGEFCTYPSYYGSDGFSAARKLFGLENADPYKLFDGDYYTPSNPTPRAVARRIRKFVKEAEAK